MPKAMKDGKLVDVEDFGDADDAGHFLRRTSVFHDRVTADGSSGFRAEPGRYHLYVSHACPWAHRTLILRKLKKLEEVISVSVVHPLMGPESWHFGECDGCTEDHLFGSRYLYEVYTRARADYTGIVTVPALFDRETGTIVNNESAEIIRMLNSEFDAWGEARLDFYPEKLRPAIDAINREVYDNVNDGVYRAGFAHSQRAYDEAVESLFAALDRLEKQLAHQRFLTGDRVTEADWRLFTTLVRFDAVYYLHFKCNRKRLVDYPNLWNYTRDLYQVPGVAETVRLDHIKQHYYGSHPQLNPRGIVPAGPDIDFFEPHDRYRLVPEAPELGM
ncbi:glutathione S-transferase family protein [Thiohalomonas denitrificans]|uniref:Putative glutathione S-transferase n=1 Tax=Thiohalomonas denitrificans TaxID=415747 RepID=A0A1G5Q8M4_9GAMM|nr:glutathione S-transferase family protein [Thiohalomonas denitrificans]SCZ57741.1 putative glutathione S-transferase [Thiohalomonas denitrificans]